MLPGFRFLFTAIVLSMSILMFGLGAAALLRAAHEEFANLPVATGAARAGVCPPERRPAADTGPAARRSRRSDPSSRRRMLRPPQFRKPPSMSPAPAEPDKLAALKPAESRCRPEAAKPEAPAKEASAETAPAPAAETEAPAANAEVKIAAIAATPEPAAATPPAISPEPAADIPSFEGNIATTLIATLGGPAVYRRRNDHRRSRTAASSGSGRAARSGTAADCARGARAWRARPR